MHQRVLIRLALLGLVALPALALATPTRLAAQNADALYSSADTAHSIYFPLMTHEPITETQNVFPSTLRFGVYPGGATGEIAKAPTPSTGTVIGQLNQLGGGRPLIVHLFTAWSWYNAAALDDQIASFGAAGFQIFLTVKYSPPEGHVGDVSGYEAFVRTVVARYGGSRGMDSFVIGNEANVYGNPEASDGSFAQSHSAVVRGVIAARQVLVQMGSPARVGMNFALTSADSDAAFLGELAQIGGDQFASSVQFVGVNLYPGLWPAGTGQPYVDMLTGLESARASVNSVAGLSGRAIDILEVGAPTVNEPDQANRLQQFVQATLDNRVRLQIASLCWFDLWDGDSGSADLFAHYGLLHSDLSPKPAFGVLQQALTAP